MDYGPKWPPPPEPPVRRRPWPGRTRRRAIACHAAWIIVRTYVWSLAALWFGRAAGWI